MNLEELRTKFIDYLSQKGKLDDNKIIEMMSLPASVFCSGAEFMNFAKENLASLGIKGGKIPSSVSELLDMINKEDKEEEYDIPEQNESANLNGNKVTEEVTFNKGDYSKNNIRNTYDKDGKLLTQEASVYNATGSKRSKYITQFDAAGDVNSEFQIQYEANNKKPNIDMSIGYTEQGEKGDCWLLSTLNSLSYTDKGKNIIKNAISKNEDGTYSIEFKGVNQKVKITPEELQDAKKSGQYSAGDDDSLLFELGFESILKKINNGEIQINGKHPGLSITKHSDSSKVLSGGNLEDAIFLLTGNDVKSEFKSTGASTDNFDKILSTLKDNPGKYAAIIGFSAGDNPLVLRDINGKEICTLSAGTDHAFSIKSVDEDGVTIVNPWDSSKEYKISLADARKFSNGIQYYALDENFQETDNLDSTNLDSAKTLSSDAPTASPSGASPSTPSGNYSPSASGGNPTGSGDNSSASGDKNIKNMSLDELKAKKTESENTLKTKQDEYNAIMDGSDKEISDLKTNADKEYETFKTELEKQDADLAHDYDEAKKAEDDKKTEIDNNSKEITETENSKSAAETMVKNAEAKVNTLNNSVSELTKALSSANNSEKPNIQKKLSEAQKALEAAQKEKDTAIAEQNRLEEQLKTLNETKTKLEGELEPLTQKVVELEAKISGLTENSPELKTAYDTYKAAEKTYEDTKTNKASAAKAAVAAQQKELNEINSQISALENKQLGNKYSNTKLNKTYTLNGEEYLSLMSQDELNNFLSGEWSRGNYNHDSNCLSMSYVYSNDIMRSLGLSGRCQDYINDSQASVEQRAKEALDNGYPAILHVSTKAGTRHFATAVGYRIADDGSISFLLADNVRGVGITACGNGQYRHLITGYSTPYANQNYGYRCMVYG